MVKNSFQDQLQQLGKQAKAKRLAEEQQAKEVQKRQTDVNFAEAIGKDITPLKARNQFQHPRDTSPIKLRVQQKELINDVTSYFYIGESQDNTAPAVFSKNGRGKADIKRLQAKQWPIVAYVDLHGYRQDETQEVLNEFIDYIQQYGVVGEIVHGSGLGSKDYQPVLKTLVRRWLMAHPEVLAYAQPNERNDGAVYVLVKKKHRRFEQE
ncbi:Smr/MutS family protein [Snodgrassella sp. M0118]|nr:MULTISPECIES: Smr/MutS family protein [unclassified Snodgrassella]MBI0067462.1 Smr/MutS family protein [Snodgrassella sp. M0110]MBI0076573.1 Smr/MutS family protein [Snodgrassella sp. M0118]MBI0078763.1 Smr/MutS family protein [Snodgrassella sp. M0112]NUF78544.1 Smr domain protein [Snodgrassella sp. ESL0323]